MSDRYEDGGGWGGAGSCVVMVQALVMVRDDSMGGWLPVGGLSRVSVRRRHARYEPQTPDRAAPAIAATSTSPAGGAPIGRPSPATAEYAIFGCRVKDGVSVLNCTIKPDFVYHKVIPTFHHWSSGDKRFGLTFQTAADASSFDRGVRCAVHHLLQGLSDSSNSDYSPLPPPRSSSPLQSSNRRLPSSAMVNIVDRSRRYRSEDDQTFMTLDLPVERADSRTSSPSSATSHLHPVTYASDCGTTQDGHYPYVQLTTQPPGVAKATGLSPVSPAHSGDTSAALVAAVGTGKSAEEHGYSYPTVGDVFRQKEVAQRAAGTATPPISAPPLPPPLPPPIRRCRRCRQPYSEAWNRRGACTAGGRSSDHRCARKCVETVTCVPLARRLMRWCCHISSDADDCEMVAPSNVQRPVNRGSQRRCRCLSLLLISLFLPCLCCYPPLSACVHCMDRCSVCGQKHEPTSM